MHLPDASDREWLIDNLNRLIVRAGAGRFLSGRIVLPDDDHFPDRWEPNTEGVARITARLLAYAGMHGYQPAVALWRDERGPNDQTAAFFLGFDGNRCLFGVDGSYFDSPDLLVGTMAHEVAHAFRAAHDLVVAERDTEELLTDLTAVYLGFGVLLANGSYEYRSYQGRRGDVGNPHWSTYEHRKLGYLPYQAVSFALAAQAIARDADPKAIRRSLSSAQRESFDAAVRELRRQPLLKGLLGVGRPADSETIAIGAEPPTSAPAPAALQAMASAHASDPRKRFSGQDVYVWFKGNGSGYAWGAFAISMLGGLPILMMEHPLAYGVVVVVPTLLAWLYGRGQGWFECASCGEILSDLDASTCGGCGGTIRGQIRNPRERLDVDESEHERV